MLAAVVLALPLASGHTRAAYSQAELDQMLAPIALYPDPLLSQILMAATRPEEVADAARWSADHRGVDGDAAVRMVEPFDWDPSVKSLVAFPNVLQRLGQSPDWTRNLGEAFLVQEPQVMETMQGLRRRAEAAGTLSSDDNVRILEEPQGIAILPANPQWMYVPYYDPWVAYGSWWWPAYPPFAWDPWPGYYSAYRPYYSSAFWWGPRIGLSAGFFFAAIDWPRQHVRIARTDNFYVRPWVERHHLGATPGRWRADFWQRRDFARLGAATQPQAVAPGTRQFAAPAQRQFSGTTAQRQFSSATTPRQFPASRQFSSASMMAAPAQQPRRWEERRHEMRPAPLAWAPAMQQAAPAPRMPAPRFERGPAPRAQYAPVPRAQNFAPRAEHAFAGRGGEHRGRDR